MSEELTKREDPSQDLFRATSSCVENSNQQMDFSEMSIALDKLAQEEIICQQLEKHISELKEKHAENERQIQLQQIQIASDTATESALRLSIQKVNESISAKQTTLQLLKEKYDHKVKQNKAMDDKMQAAIDFYEKRYKEAKAKFERLPLAKEKNKKEIELKNMQIQLKIVKQKVQEQIKRNKQINEIRTKRKQLEIIQFAEKMVRYNNILKSEREIEEYKRKIDILQEKKKEKKKISAEIEENSAKKSSELNSTPIDMKSLELPTLSPVGYSEYDQTMLTESFTRPQTPPSVSKYMKDFVQGYSETTSIASEAKKLRNMDQSLISSISTQLLQPKGTNIITKRKFLTVSFDLKEKQTTEQNDFLPKSKLPKIDIVTNEKDNHSQNEQGHTTNTQIFENLVICDSGQKDDTYIEMSETDEKFGNDEHELLESVQQKPSEQTKSPYFNISVQPEDYESQESSQQRNQNDQEIIIEDRDENLSAQTQEVTSSVLQSYEESVENNGSVVENMGTGSTTDQRTDSLQYYEMNEFNASNLYTESMSDINSVSNLLMSPNLEISGMSHFELSPDEDNLSVSSPIPTQNLPPETSKPVYNMFAPKPTNTKENAFSFSFNTPANPKVNKPFSMF